MHSPPTQEQLAMAPWMAAARAEHGVAEQIGKGNAVRVLQYLASCKGPRSMLQIDSTPWCAAYVAWCLEQVHIASTDSLAARSYLQYGDEIPQRDARYGDIVVLWRGMPLPSSVTNAPGHVGFLDRIVGEQVLIMGGNQRGDRVSVQSYPLRRVLAFRRPSVADLALHDLMRRA
ncbi:MAG TPA: TIGR02594 family protein [Polyangiales bacterium]|nr:TIGR02594 family protein [Polyangiales bacterium]